MKVIKADRVVYGFSNQMEAVEKVNLGEEFIVETNDCFYNQIKSDQDLAEEIDMARINPATGPIFVQGAQAGDILKVTILDIELDKQGVALSMPGGGALGDLVKKPVTKLIELKEGQASWDGFKLDLRPMIGVIGVATQDRDGYLPTNTPYSHGGNMDTKELGIGTSIYLPVSQEGAYLALGDLHGVMGDGELCFTGLEMSGRVRLVLDLIKNKHLDWPLLETQDDLMVIASQKTMDKALYSCTSTLVGYISQAKHISFEEAYILASLAMDVRISQVVNPLVTLRAAIPKSIISMEELINAIK